jgi:hypothetical protein
MEAQFPQIPISIIKDMRYAIQIFDEVVMSSEEMCRCNLHNIYFLLGVEPKYGYNESYIIIPSNPVDN